MGGGKRKTKTEQRIQYPAGFESFFKRAGDIILKHAQIPRSSIFEMKLSPFEKDIYGRISSLLSAGATPVDTLIQNYFLNRMGISSPLLRAMSTEPSLRILPSLSEGMLPEYSEPIPPAIGSLPKREEEKEWSLPTTWQQLFAVTPFPKTPSDILRNLQMGAVTLQLMQQFPELGAEETQGLISSMLSRPGYTLKKGTITPELREPTLAAYDVLRKSGLTPNYAQPVKKYVYTEEFGSVPVSESWWY